MLGRGAERRRRFARPGTRCRSMATGGRRGPNEPNPRFGKSGSYFDSIYETYLRLTRLNPVFVSLSEPNIRIGSSKREFGSRAGLSPFSPLFFPSPSLVVGAVGDVVSRWGRMRPHRLSKGCGKPGRFSRDLYAALPCTGPAARHRPRLSPPASEDLISPIRSRPTAPPAPPASHPAHLHRPSGSDGTSSARGSGSRPCGPGG